MVNHFLLLMGNDCKTISVIDLLFQRRCRRSIFDLTPPPKGIVTAPTSTGTKKTTLNMTRVSLISSEISLKDNFRKKTTRGITANRRCF